MYCNKCGKQIEKGTVCNECLVAELVGTEQTKEDPVAQAPVNAAPMQDAAPQAVAQNEVKIDEAGNFTFFNEYVNANVPERTSTMPEPNNRMYGFGKALTSTILSEIGFVFVYVALIATIAAPVGGLVLSLLSLPLIIIPLVMGIASIKVFKARRSTCVKPIPTLILGIVGTSTAAVTAWIAIITILASIGMMA